MARSWWILAIGLLLPIPDVARAQPGGVQWTPDALRILVNKDVGAERWAITLNLLDATVTGNVFFTDARPPLFLWCERTGHNHSPSLAELLLSYRCFGSERAQSVFTVGDWSLVSDQVTLDGLFFAPPPETCDLSGAFNGANAQSATSFWDCNGSSGPFQFQAFADGTGFSSNIGAFAFDLADGGCGFGQRADGAFFNAAYSPSRQRLLLYEVDPTVSRFTLSECVRGDL